MTVFCTIFLILFRSLHPLRVVTCSFDLQICISYLMRHSPQTIPRYWQAYITMRSLTDCHFYTVTRSRQQQFLTNLFPSPASTTLSYNIDKLIVLSIHLLQNTRHTNKGFPPW